MRNALHLAVIAALLSPVAQAAGSYSNIYFFGDSLTDSGAFGGQAIPNGSGGFAILPGNARWTINNAANHADVLASKLGLSVSASNAGSSLGSAGNNFAQGGAQSVNYATGATLPSGEQQGAGPGNLDIRDLPQQVQDYLTAHGGKADAQAVYFVWSGGNDIPTAALSANPQQTAVDAVQSQAAQIATLKQAGARLIIAPNLPAFGNTPAALFTVIDRIGSAQGLSAANISALKSLTSSVLRSEATPDSSSQQALLNRALATLASALSGGATSGVVYDTVLQTVSNGYDSSKNGLNSLSTFYNLNADAAIGSTGANVVRANVNALFAEVLANPAAYGIDNTTGPACGTTSSLVCTSSNVSGTLSYLFADDRHPSPQTHALLGNYFASLLQAPYFAEALGKTATAAYQRHAAALDARARTLDHEQRAAGSSGVFSSVGGGKQDVGSQGQQASGELLTLGVDHQLSPTLSVGLAFTQGRLDTGLGSQGSYDSKHKLMSLAGNYRDGAFWLDGDASLGIADLDTRRNVELGSTQRIERGNTRATYHQLRVNAGYRMSFQQLKTGPLLGVTVQDGHINAFTEQGRRSTSMRFGEQKLGSTVLQAGWEAQASLGSISPYLSVSMKQEQQDQARALQAGVYGTRGEFSVDGHAADKRWTEWQIGSSITLSKDVHAFAQASGSSGRSDGQGTLYQLGLSASF